MEIEYSKEDLKNIIKSYYLETEGENVEVKIEARKELTGIYETISNITTIEILKRETILGREIRVKETISKDTIINIFTELLENEGYTLESLEYNDGIHTRTVGYFMDEHTEYTAYFKGIKIRASKVKALKRK